MSEAEKIIYSMYKVSKHYEKIEIIGDISLSYFYGAKIGVLGLNGSGKSTLPRIMAGVDADRAAVRMSALTQNRSRTLTPRNGAKSVEHREQFHIREADVGIGVGGLHHDPALVIPREQRVGHTEAAVETLCEMPCRNAFSS